ncbi:MAG: symmetrical bis(5'-nucleosyl)-tetraphosphatase [Planctomycetes bacterium]|nr:symmetrical bis(5'-nucleosyl)-tetraphosphatase [Planctomycetota bacterium]
MATYAVGDVQGCWRTLQRLLDRVSPTSDDRLWLAGDLVNRGRGSLEVLRWAARQRGLTAVLGNHDLHLLARAAGTRASKGKDTLDAVLEAPDRADLLDWLATRPLLVRDGDRLLVHAGLLPSWTPEAAAALAAEVDAARAADRRAFLEALAAGPSPLAWREGLSPDDRLRLVVAALTRVRCCRADGTMDLDYSGPPAAAPRGLVPWFEAPGRRSAGATIVFGHWAALGLVLVPGVVALDTGCVWGRALTCVRLEDGAVVQEPAHPKDLR